MFDFVKFIYDKLLPRHRYDIFPAVSADCAPPHRNPTHAYFKHAT